MNVRTAITAGVLALAALGAPVVLAGTASAAPADNPGQGPVNAQGYEHSNPAAPGQGKGRAAPTTPPSDPPPAPPGTYTRTAAVWWTVGSPPTWGYGEAMAQCDRGDDPVPGSAVMSVPTPGWRVETGPTEFRGYDATKISGFSFTFGPDPAAGSYSSAGQGVITVTCQDTAAGTFTAAEQAYLDALAAAWPGPPDGLIVTDPQGAVDLGWRVVERMRAAPGYSTYAAVKVWVADQVGDNTGPVRMSAGYGGGLNGLASAITTQAVRNLAPELGWML